MGTAAAVVVRFDTINIDIASSLNGHSIGGRAGDNNVVEGDITVPVGDRQRNIIKGGDP